MTAPDLTDLATRLRHSTRLANLDGYDHTQGNFTRRIHQLLTALVPVFATELEREGYEVQYNGNPLERALTPPQMSDSFVLLKHALELGERQTRFTPPPVPAAATNIPWARGLVGRLTGDLEDIGIENEHVGCRVEIVGRPGAYDREQGHDWQVTDLDCLMDFVVRNEHLAPPTPRTPEPITLAPNTNAWFVLDRDILGEVGLRAHVGHPIRILEDRERRRGENDRFHVQDNQCRLDYFCGIEQIRLTDPTGPAGPAPLPRPRFHINDRVRTLARDEEDNGFIGSTGHIVDFDPDSEEYVWGVQLDGEDDLTDTHWYRAQDLEHLT